MQLPELLKRILYGVGAVVGTFSTGYGLYSIARDITSRGIPSWAYLVIGLGLVFIIFLSIIYSLWKENRELKADPSLKLKVLGQECKHAISQMNTELESLIKSADIPSEDKLEKFEIEQVKLAGLNIEKAKEAIGADNVMTIGKVFASIQSEMQPITILYRSLTPLLLKLMNKFNIGLESIKTERYRQLEDNLEKLIDKRTSIEVRGSSNVHEKFKDYMMCRSGYYSFLLQKHYEDNTPDNARFKQKASTTFEIIYLSIPGEIKERLEQLEIALIESISSTYGEEETTKSK